MLVGIDYGSNLAGTTVIATLTPTNELHFYSSEKKRSADDFLIENLSKLDVKQVFIDAPLSLPGVYTKPAIYNNYFFRQCDKELKCMSPMFLGGLTARAMRLKNTLTNINFIETYPSFHAKRLTLKALDYKKKVSAIAIVLAKMQTEFDFKLPPTLPNWHHVDALLALLSAIRHSQKQHLSFGSVEEGQIIL